MAMSSDNVETYVTQWLETATKGNVIVTFAWLTNRMQLHCKVCQSEHTCPKPKSSSEIDYSVQEFVKLHSHQGGHVADPWTSYKMSFGVTNPKYLKQTQISNVAPGKIIEIDPKIDDKPEMAQKIADQMAKYDSEIKAKFETQAYENKIKILQMAEQAKQKLELQKQEAFEKKFGSKTLQELAVIEMEMETKLKTDLLKQMMKMQGQAEPEPEKPKPAKKDKPLKRPEGRKFR